MEISITNAQHEAPVHRSRMTRIAKRAVQQLRIRTRGTLAIMFLDRRAIRTLNRRFLRHDRPTDVLSFRYNHVRGSGFGVRSSCPQPRALNPEPIVGEIFIAPALARAYAARHGFTYDEELARYVVHGILHWLGHEDRTPAQRAKMRKNEDRLLARCATGRRI